MTSTDTQMTLVADDTPTLTLDDLVIDPKHNVRETVTAASVADLADSIEELGIHTAVLVTRMENGKYQLLAGYRRCHAAGVVQKRNNRPVRIPYTVVEGSDADLEAAHLLENLHRQDLNPIEEATGIARLVELGSDLDVLARQIGRSKAHVAGRLKLLALPAKAQKALKAGDLAISHAAALLALDPQRQKTVMAPKDWLTRNLTWSIEQQQREQDEHRKTDERIAGLTKSGTTVIDLRKGGSLPKGAQRVAMSAYEDGLQIAPGHRSEPCRLVVVAKGHYRGIDELEYCTDPARHQKDGDSELKVKPKSKSTISPAEKAKRAKDRERKAALLAGLNDLAGSKIPKAEVGELAVELCMANQSADGWKRVCEVLGLDKSSDCAVRDTRYSDRQPFLHEATARAWGDASAANLAVLRLTVLLTYQVYDLTSTYIGSANGWSGGRSSSALQAFGKKHRLKVPK